MFIYFSRWLNIYFKRLAPFSFTKKNFMYFLNMQFTMNFICFIDVMVFLSVVVWVFYVFGLPVTSHNVIANRYSKNDLYSILCTVLGRLKIVPKAKLCLLNLVLRYHFAGIAFTVILTSNTINFLIFNK